MAIIKPFRGIKYNIQLFSDLRLVTSPPYDVITKERRDYYFKLNDYNVIRLILDKDMPGDDEYNNKYTRAASYLKSWKRDGILVDDLRPNLYFYEQEFTGPAGQKLTRQGFFALVKLEDYKAKKIFPHEKTKSAPKEDRLKLLRSTYCNLCSVFVLYSDPQKETEAVFNEVKKSYKYWGKFTDDENVTHTLWTVGKKDIIERMCKFMSDKQLIIADGHHRYETALRYQKEMCEITGKTDGEQPFDYITMYLTSMESEGLVILPTHRMLHQDLCRDVNIADVLDELAVNLQLIDTKVKFTDVNNAAREITMKLEELGKKNVAFALLLPNSRVIYLVLKPEVNLDELIDNDNFSQELKKLDVVILHHYILPQVWIGNPEVEIEDDDISYTHDVKEAIAQLRARKAGAAIILNPPNLENIKKIVLNGELMPPKTTYFYPKVVTGLVMRDMSIS